MNQMTSSQAEATQAAIRTYKNLNSTEEQKNLAIATIERQIAFLRKFALSSSSRGVKQTTYAQMKELQDLIGQKPVSAWDLIKR